MKRLHLFEAVGLVDDRLVEEAAGARRTVRPWSKWLAAAAFAALALSLGTAAAGTLFRGCGSKSAGNSMADMAAAPAAPADSEQAVSQELSPEAEVEDYGFVQDGAEEKNAAVTGREDAPAEPEEALPDPDPAPTAEPAAEPGTGGDGVSLEGEMGALRNTAPELFAAAGEIVITPRETEKDDETGPQLARYWAENQSGAERAEILHFTLDTGEEGLDERNLEIRIDGETVPFDAFEAVACPTEDGAFPERDGRHFLIEFAVNLPAWGKASIEIQY